MSEAGWVKYNMESGDSDKLESTCFVQMGKDSSLQPDVVIMNEGPNIVRYFFVIFSREI